MSRRQSTSVIKSERALVIPSFIMTTVISTIFDVTVCPQGHFSFRFVTPQDWRDCQLVPTKWAAHINLGNRSTGVFGPFAVLKDNYTSSLLNCSSFVGKKYLTALMAKLKSPAWSIIGASVRIHLGQVLQLWSQHRESPMSLWVSGSKRAAFAIKRAMFSKWGW